jgi:hypothetical protein
MLPDFIEWICVSDDKDEKDCIYRHVEDSIGKFGDDG